MHRVAITGLGCISALGPDAESHWAAGRDGRSGIDTITQVDPARLNVKICGEVKGCCCRGEPRGAGSLAESADATTRGTTQPRRRRAVTRAATAVPFRPSAHPRRRQSSARAKPCVSSWWYRAQQRASSSAVHTRLAAAALASSLLVGSGAAPRSKSGGSAGGSARRRVRRCCTAYGVRPVASAKRAF